MNIPDWLYNTVAVSIPILLILGVWKLMELTYWVCVHLRLELK